jgi:hypothetical protein
MTAAQLAARAISALDAADAFDDPDRRRDLFEEAIAFALASIARSLTARSADAQPRERSGRAE